VGGVNLSAQLPEFVERLVIDGTRVGWWPDRIAAWERGEKIAPVTIDCAMTRACNAACHFCYAQLQANEADGKVTKEAFFDFLTDAAAIGVKGVSFISDGESTVVPWWADAVHHAASVGLKVGAGSNGIRLTKDVLEKALPFLSYLRFNFTGGERHRYSEIMGVSPAMFDVVVQNVRDAMEIVRRDGLMVSVNLQMVLDPCDADQIIPFAEMCAELKPTYGVIKHCADDAAGTLGVDYSKYAALKADLERAEEIGREAGVRITAKWDKIQSEGKRRYDRCFGSPFIMQVSGSGLVANCGFHFNERFKKFHMGNITQTRFREIWESPRYMEIMNYLAGDEFNPQTRCGSLCLQDSVNKFLYEYKAGRIALPTTPAPPHIEFV
jgi:MoaA/NifB/PqqE/SkfB family radical SAM enzyme